MGDSIVDAWGDLTVGDRVHLRIPGRSDGNPDVYEVVELRLSGGGLASSASEAIAVVCGPHDEVETMNARFLRKLA